jgi:tetratricopeptide (TPR) repeat protein
MAVSIDVCRPVVAELCVLADSLGVEERAEAAWRECQLARLAEERERARKAGERAISFAVEAKNARAEAMAHRELAMLLADEVGDEAARHAEAAHALAEKSGDEWLVALSLSAVAYVDIAQGRRAGSIALLQDAAQRFAKVGDQRRESAMRGNAGDILIEVGRLEEAAAQITAAIESSEQFGHHRALAVGLHNLGLVRRLEGDLETARSLQSRAMELAERLTFKRLAAAIAIELAYIALDARQKAEDAAERARAAADECGVASLVASSRAISARVSPNEQSIAELRAIAPSSDLARLEIAAAIGDEAKIRAALEKACSAAPPEDRDKARSALARRYVLRSS